MQSGGPGPTVCASAAQPTSRQTCQRGRWKECPVHPARSRGRTTSPVPRRQARAPAPPGVPEPTPPAGGAGVRESCRGPRHRARADGCPVRRWVAQVRCTVRESVGRRAGAGADPPLSLHEPGPAGYPSGCRSGGQGRDGGSGSPARWGQLEATDGHPEGGLGGDQADDGPADRVGGPADPDEQGSGDRRGEADHGHRTTRILRPRERRRSTASTAQPSGPRTARTPSVQRDWRRPPPRRGPGRGRR